MIDRWNGVVLAAGAAFCIGATALPALAENAADCPYGGTIRFAVEPFHTAPKLAPIYEHIGKLIGDKVGCEVKVFVTTNYNAEIEAMTRVATNTAARRGQVIATGSSVSSRITE